MVYGRVICQVIEMPAGGRLSRGSEWPRDLLPWADPYIATLMVRLERQYDWADDAPSGGNWSDEATGGDWLEPEHDHPLADHPLADDEAAFSAAFFGDAWFGDTQDADAFMPGWHEGPRRPLHPPVYGGFPLLDDVTDGLEEDPV
jgi:hypothetical protein